MLELGLGSCAQNYGWKLALVSLHVGLQKWAELPHWGKGETHFPKLVCVAEGVGRKQLEEVLGEALSEKWAELPHWGKVVTGLCWSLQLVEGAEG